MIFILGMFIGALITYILIDEIEEYKFNKMMDEIPLDEKKKEQEENADYYFNEAEKIIKENDSHIPHLDQKGVKVMKKEMKLIEVLNLVEKGKIKKRNDIKNI